MSFDEHPCRQHQIPAAWASGARFWLRSLPRPPPPRYSDASGVRRWLLPVCDQVLTRDLPSGAIRCHLHAVAVVIAIPSPFAIFRRIRLLSGRTGVIHVVTAVIT